MAKVNLKNHSAFLCTVLAVAAAAVLRQIGFRVEAPSTVLPLSSATLYT